MSMRFLRVVVVLVFALSLVAFGYYYYNVELSVDKTRPTLSCEHEVLRMSVKDGQEKLFEDLRALDSRDGDLKDEIRLVSFSRFNEEMERTASYIVFDHSGNMDTLTRQVVYSDYHSPRIYLSEPLRVHDRDARNMDILGLMTAEDVLDGDLTSVARFSMNELYSPDPGEYPIVLSVTNSAGDTTNLPLSLSVIATDMFESRRYYPVLSEYIAYTKVGRELDLSSFLIGILNNNEMVPFPEAEEQLHVIEANVAVIADGLDWNVPGVYPVTYRYTSGLSYDEVGVPAETTLFIVVEE